MAEKDHYKFGIAKKSAAQTQAIRNKFAAMVPTTWLDPLLTGPKAVIGQPPYNCKDIERLMWHLAERIRAAPNRGVEPK